MTIQEISKILNMHHISHKLNGGRLYAEEVGIFNGTRYNLWLDVTGWSFKKLLNWIGY